MGDISIKGRSPLVKGGRVGFNQGNWAKGKFSDETVAAMKKRDFPAGGPHQTVEGKKAALQHLTKNIQRKKKKT